MANVEAKPFTRSIRVGNFVYRMGNHWTMDADDYFRELGEAEAEFLDGHRKGPNSHPSETQPAPLHIPTATETDPDLSGLEFTDQQIQILALLASGLSRSKMLELGIVESTIDYRRGQIREKVGVVSPNGRDLAALAVAHLVRQNKIKYIDPADIQSLTNREREIADLVRRGFTNVEIRQICTIEHKTLECHLSAIRIAIDAKTHLEMVAKLEAAEKLEK